MNERSREHENECIVRCRKPKGSEDERDATDDPSRTNEIESRGTEQGNHQKPEIVHPSKTEILSPQTREIDRCGDRGWRARALRMPVCVYTRIDGWKRGRKEKVTDVRE